MKLSGGRLKTTFNAPTVLLTHPGAKSGKKRTTPDTCFTKRRRVPDSRLASCLHPEGWQSG